MESKKDFPADRKPISIEEYKIWLKENLGIEITDKHKMLYDLATSSIKRDFESSSFWNQLVEHLPIYREDYKLQTGYDLLLNEKPPTIWVKPFNSVLDKTYRKNVIENKEWPKSPNNKWILPDEWDLRISDIIRTSITVKYLDGVDFMVNKIKAICENLKESCEIDYEASEVGYYAAHLYTVQDFEIPTLTWETRRIDLSIEIQITTQLQEAIRRLIHKYYEEKRCKIITEDLKWQWNYKSDEFTANYLGHILHYLEGMIIEIREKQKERGKNEKRV